MSDQTCNQHNCTEPAIALFTWPGKNEAGICVKHLPALTAIASSMGLYIQVKPLGTALAALPTPGTSGS